MLGKAGLLGKGVTPRSLKIYMDNFVISQARAKRLVSAAVYNHYMRVHHQQLLTRRHHAAPLDADPLVVAAAVDAPGGPSADSPSGVVEPIELQKSNVLILGPSGVGKTLIARTIARILDVPFSISDCTAFTQAGYVGEDVDVCVQRLLSSCNWDVKRAETGIIVLDEVDKIASTKTMSHGRDVSGEGVQQALLKILEGTTLHITNTRSRQAAGHPSHSSSMSSTSAPPPPASPSSPSTPESPFQTFGSFGSGNVGGGGSQFGGKGDVYTIDTSNILFILCGAFNGLNKIILDRIARHSIGFNAPVRQRGSDANRLPPELEDEMRRLYGSYFLSTEDHHLEHNHAHSSGVHHLAPVQNKRRRLNPLELTEPNDLISFGFLPEFIGRLPVLAALDAFDEELLVRVLSEPRNSLLKQYQQLFEMSGVELKFTSLALRDIARAALKMDTGARALRSVLEKLLADAMFEAPGSSIKYILVNSAVAQFKQPPIYFARGQQDRFLTVFATEEAEWEKSRRPLSEGPLHDEVTETEIAVSMGAG